jgi:D-alanyl-D-alanine carboxypeptidase/D-alanyl-D-alanine-endopeptidase (penicillin-binding protein 4)
VEGSGDPTISGRFTDDDRTKTFRDWAAALKALGITRIEGNIIGDDTIFDDIALGSSWSWDYTTYWYAAEMGGLSFNENCVDVEIVGTRPGEPALINRFPNTSYAQIVNETRTVHPGERTRTGYNRPWGTNTIYVSNQVAAGDTTTYSLAVTNTALYFVHVMREVFLAEGIDVDGDITDRTGLASIGDYKSNGTVLATYTSPTLGEIVYVLNKRSQNMFAENLLKTLGVWYLSQQKDRPDGPMLASAQAGHRAAGPVFGAAGVDTTRLNLADGSGMSRMNLVSPVMTTSLLRYMWSHPNEAVRTSFVESLPRGGEEIGTLRSMFLRGPAAASVAAKTGTLGYARALSGYVTAKDGTPLAFAIMVNHHTIGGSQANRAIEAIVNELAEFSYDQ